MPRTLTLFVVLFAGTFVTAAEWAVSPPVISLNGPKSSQQVIVTETVAGRVIADHTAAAKYASSDPKVVTVGADGLLTATGNGTATLTATVNGKSATATATVSNFDRPFRWSFVNHVQPTLTRAGCNSGACHGALAGKGGFKVPVRRITSGWWRGVTGFAPGISRVA